ncbi:MULTISPECIES: hypothetical protein [unclassified Streptomyces]|uniref:hypothetical protein n=1 Tax=unclassified Streptomyces TaxID=2593676 RepID=UPI0013DBCE54|nr:MULTISPECIES: hypothetical protein [unclassified Streptomyces]NMI56012.1 hypothetical protein [Streptomyces sp. RLA2-12]
MLPIGSLKDLLRAIGEQTVHGLRAIDPHGGAGHARRNDARAAAAYAKRGEHDLASPR